MPAETPGARARTALRLIGAIGARMPQGATAEELALALADLWTLRGLQKRLRTLARAGKLRRKWEYFDPGNGGLVGRWRYFA